MLQNLEKEQLFEIVCEFIKKHKISCGEAIYQNDEISLNSLEFIEKCCESVGYFNRETNNIEHLQD